MILRAIPVAPPADGVSTGVTVPGLFDTVGDTGPGSSNGNAEPVAGEVEPAAGNAPLMAGDPAGPGAAAPASASAPGPAGPGAAIAYRLTAVLTADTKQLLDRASELLRRSVHPGDVDAVLNPALRLLVESTERRRFGKTRRPRTQRPPRHSGSPRSIPAAVRRAVVERDGGRCTFVASDGHRCAERGNLEFHHRHPLARGGPTTVDNLTLLCAAHHRRLTERGFGRFQAKDAPRIGSRDSVNSR